MELGKVATPNLKSIEDVAAFLNENPQKMVKTLMLQNEREENIAVLLPVSVGMALLGEPFVRLIFQRGAFDAALAARRQGVPCFKRVYGTFLSQLFQPAAWRSPRYRTIWGWAARLA